MSTLPPVDFRSWWTALAQRTFRPWLAAWVLAFTAVILAGWWIVSCMTDDLRRSGVALAEARVQSRAQSYGRQLDDLMVRLDEVGQAMMAEWSRQPGSIDYLKLLVGLNLAGKPLYAASLDERGRVASASVPAPAGKEASGPLLDHHRRRCCSGWHVSPPEHSAIFGTEVVQMSHAMERPAGQLAGVLVFAMAPDFFAAFEDDSFIGKDDFVSARIADGPVLVTRLAAARTQPTAYRETPVYPAAQGVRLEPGEMFNDGVARFVAWRRHAFLPIVAVAGISRAGAMARVEHEVRLYHTVAWMMTAVLALICAAGMAIGGRLSVRRANEDEVRQVYRTATDAADEGFYMLRPLWDAQGELADVQFEDVNERGGLLLGQHRSVLLGRPASAVLLPAAFENVLELVHRALKHQVVVDEHRVPAETGLPSQWLHRHAVAIGAGVALTLRDISQAKAHEGELLELAQRDNLTGLPNRLWLHRFLPAAIQRARRAHSTLAVLFIDLDHFKPVNDTLGHDAGDRLLRDIARCLRETLRSSDPVVRLGGDEFLAIVENLDAVESIDALAQKLIDAIAGPLRTQDGPVAKVGASIGISVFPQDGERADDLLRYADIAKVHAKARGRGQHCRYLPEYSSRIAERLDNEQALRLALERDELFVHFQPKVKLRSGRLSGAEALVRWQRPGHGLVMPVEFIALAEDLGLIVPIGEQVIRRTVAQLAAWRRAGLPHLRVAVNVSPEQLRRADVAGFVQQALESQQVPPDCLEIEITESAMVEQSDAVQRQLERLRELGVRLAIDDFGTGYSSLAQLQRLDVDVIKLDRELVMPLQPGSDAEALCRAIIWMASALGLEVVAEGVETVEQRRVLSDVGCDEIQGYLVSRPLSAEEFEPLLRLPQLNIADGIGVVAATVER